MQNYRRRNIWLWSFYDFANSLALINVSLYFGPWFIAEHGKSDVWITVSVALTTILMLAILPALGHLSDKIGRRMPFLAVCTILSVLSLLALGLVGSSVQNWTLPVTILIFALYSLFNLFYLSCFTFYDSLLRSLQQQGKSLEGLSGLGMGIGQIGNVVGLFAALPLAKGNLTLFGLGGRPAIFILAPFLFLITSLPVFIFYKEERAHVSGTEKLGRTWKETYRDLRHIRRYPGVLPYLLTYALFADALLTLQLFASFYLERVGHMDDAKKTMTFLFAMIFGLIGSFASPLLVRMFGSRKRAISACIALWAAALVIIAFATHPLLFGAMITLNGFSYGALFSLSRAFFAALIPEDKQAQMFSVYSVFERTASVAGPIVWSATAFAFMSFGDDRYRFSVIALAILVGISFVIFQYVRESTESR